MDPYHLVQEYLGGPDVLEQALVGIPESRLDELPVEGTWSVRQVVCHLTDSEIVYAERIKRVMAEDNPTLFDWSPDLSAGTEFCRGRIPGTELALIRSLRQHIHGLLGNVDVEAWQRTAVHSTDGPMTLETLLERITEHIPHHVRFIEQKKAAMGIV